MHHAAHRVSSGAAAVADIHPTAIVDPRAQLDSSVRVGAYSISKAAMIMLTKQTAKEYAADGIRCNAVAPGVTRTPILDDLPDAHLNQIVAMIPQGRIAEPCEIAAMVAYLASDDASYVNGSIVMVDGAAGS